MALHSSPLRRGLDRLGVLLSALCMVHCVSGVVLVTLLGLGGGVLLDPRIHETGLAVALVIGILGLGGGVLRHQHPGVLIQGGCGLALMAVGLAVPHGPLEAVFTVLGVTILATAHIRNLRHSA